MVNFDELLEYDIQNVFENSENDDSVILQKLSLTCSEFRSRISLTIDDYFTREKGKP